MNTKDIQYFKTKLEKEKKLLEEELGSIGKKNTQTPGGWDATAGGMEIDAADENEVADKMEELEENEHILGQLEKQMEEVESALERIEKGTYGICEVGGENIEKERLEASPSAKTCKKHMK
jgi:RNA polymerase-binding transcription factor DksA